MAERIAKDLWKLDIPLVGNPLKNLNSYLILGERSLLIDTGFRQKPCMEAMERELEEIGVDRDNMDIFLTHLHSDHSGLAPELIRPGCQIFFGAVDGKRLYRNQHNPDFWKANYSSYVLEGFPEEEMEYLWTENPAKNASPKLYDEYTFVEDGHELVYGDHHLCCILTPGHTPGHMCLYDKHYKWLFSGDHVLFHITPNICRWAWAEDSLGDYLESLKKVRELEVDLLLPAHRQETGDLTARTLELEAHHARRVQEALETVRREEGLTAYEIAGRMSWSIRSRNWEEFPLTQKYFAVGEALSHLDYLAVRGKVESRMIDGKHRYFIV